MDEHNIKTGHPWNLLFLLYFFLNSGNNSKKKKRNYKLLKSVFDKRKPSRRLRVEAAH